MNLPDDIKTVVRAAVKWKKLSGNIGMATHLKKHCPDLYEIFKAAKTLSPESLKMVEEA